MARPQLGTEGNSFRLLDILFCFLIFTLGLSSYPFRSYPSITVQLPTPARLRRYLATRTPLRTETRITPYSSRTYARVLCCSFHGQDRSDNQELR